MMKTLSVRAPLELHNRIEAIAKLKKLQKSALVYHYILLGMDVDARSSPGDEVLTLKPVSVEAPVQGPGCGCGDVLPVDPNPIQEQFNRSLYEDIREIVEDKLDQEVSKMVDDLKKIRDMVSTIEDVRSAHEKLHPDWYRYWYKMGNPPLAPDEELYNCWEDWGVTDILDDLVVVKRKK